MMHMMIQRANEQTRTCRSGREVLSEQEVYRLLASVLSVGTSPRQWLRVTSRQQLAVCVNSPWLMAGVSLELEKVGEEERPQSTIADFRRWFSLITTYNHMNFRTAAGEVQTHKFQLSIVYHFAAFLRRCASTPSIPLSRQRNAFERQHSDWTWKATDSHEKARGQFEYYSLLKKPTFAKAKLLPLRKSKGQAWRQPRQPFLVVVRLLWQHPGGLEPGLRHTARRDQGRIASPPPPPFVLFHFPLVWLRDVCCAGIVRVHGLAERCVLCRAC